MGGEKVLYAPSFSALVGSPPRGRGKDPAVRGSGRGQGITPAWAGKSLEKAWGDFLKKGSPPRGRGKVFLSFCIRLLSGITPAWAGKRPSGRSGWRAREDHPRVGGEKRYWYSGLTDWVGSPPRGRGKGFFCGIFLCNRRITPAWAGKRNLQIGQSIKTGDHPRVGGEKLAFPAILARELGSPPRGRGKVKELSLIGVTDRITPAWAGKSFIVCCCTGEHEDHPRVGGEKVV